jgi:hypothetical protein
MISMQKDELELLPTKRLLAKLNQLRKCEESIELSDAKQYHPFGFIEFKDTEIWKSEYEKLKEILSQREHIERK